MRTLMTIPPSFRLIVFPASALQESNVICTRPFWETINHGYLACSHPRTENAFGCCKMFVFIHMYFYCEAHGVDEWMGGWISRLVAYRVSALLPRKAPQMTQSITYDMMDDGYISVPCDGQLES